MKPNNKDTPIKALTQHIHKHNTQLTTSKTRFGFYQEYDSKSISNQTSTTYNRALIIS